MFKNKDQQNEKRQNFYIKSQIIVINFKFLSNDAFNSEIKLLLEKDERIWSYRDIENFIGTLPGVSANLL